MSIPNGLSPQSSSRLHLSQHLASDLDSLQQDPVLTAFSPMVSTQASMPQSGLYCPSYEFHG
jgi:hypothetical protein